MSGSSATSDATKPVKTTVPMDNVVTTLLQHRDQHTLKSLIPGLSKLNWQSNVGQHAKRVTAVTRCWRACGREGRGYGLTAAHIVRPGYAVSCRSTLGPGA